MKYNPLGRTDVKVSEICLGTMTWGSQNSEAEGHEQMDYAVSQGVNFFDAAELYPVTPISPKTQGDTEAIIGTWFANRGKRDDIILATKVAGPGRAYIENGDPLNPGKIRRACEASLKRLQTDYIDLYQIHWPNRNSYNFRQSWKFAPDKEDPQKCKDDIAMILETLATLIDEGKVRHVGLSNETTWGAAHYVKAAENAGLPRIASVQNEYSLMHRLFDLDFAELSHQEDVGLLAYSPLACGMLSGKYDNGALPDNSRRTIYPDIHGRWSDRSVPVMHAYNEIARRHGLDPAQMALAFCISRPFMTSTIIGATTMDQLKANIGAKDVTLSDAVMKEIFDVYQSSPIPL